MSPNINSFVGDLVAMAQAVEELPKVQAENTELHGKLADAYGTITAREEAILRYKDEIETLHSRVRSLEVERDDAGFRVLEVEDRMSAAIRSFRLIGDEVASAVLLIDPPKPEPAPQAMPVSGDPTQDTSSYGGEPGQSEPLPTHPTGVSENSPPMSEAQTSLSETSSSTSSPPSYSPEPPAPDTTHRSLTEADIDPNPEGRFVGKKYWETVESVNREGWLKGGGALEDYRYGPERPIIEGNND